MSRDGHGKEDRLVMINFQLIRTIRYNYSWEL
jgi:hypothetical protein